MKDIVGIIKEIDKLGRIVIPKEHRERFGLRKDVEIIVTEHGILLRNPQYKLVRTNDTEKTPITSVKIVECYKQSKKERQ